MAPSRFDCSIPSIQRSASKRLWLRVMTAVGVAWGSHSLAAQDAALPTAETTAGKIIQVDQPTDGGQANNEQHDEYVRVLSVDGKPKALQTATVRFKGQPGSEFEGKVVDLVGVVHIGQLEYYESLSKQLATYDQVLYELVAPDGTRIKPEDLEKRRSMLASLQTGMKDMLNLEYQLEKIDYMSENFRHADMSPDEFAEDLNRRGDSVWKMVARMMGAGLASQAQNGADVGLLMALFSDDRAMVMKQTMARQLVDMELVTAGMDDANGENTLIKGRNRKAFEVLREVLKVDGHDKVAVFYGAGHLSDMSERLERDFQMKAIETSWLDAWDLTRN